MSRSVKRGTVPRVQGNALFTAVRRVNCVTCYMINEMYALIKISVNPSVMFL